MKHYRELTGDDVLQAGDSFYAFSLDRWDLIHEWMIGTRANQHFYPFRRPLAPAEITAAERVKFEVWCSQNHSISIKRILPPNCDPKYFSNTIGHYWHSWTQSFWQAWCAAVNCDPMGDVGNE